MRVCGPDRSGNSGLEWRYEYGTHLFELSETREFPKSLDWSRECLSQAVNDQGRERSARRPT